MNVEKLTWYVARSGGIVAWVLLAAGIVLGLLLSSRVLGRRASPAWILSVHRYLGGLAVIFTGIHVVAIMLDDFVDFGLVEVLLPMASSWRPGAVAWGIVAMYLMIAIELTSFAMKRLPKGLWRGVHWSSAPLFVVATLHGYQAGTDAGQAFIIAIVATCVLLAGLTVVRVLMARQVATEPKTDPRKLVAQAKALKSNKPAGIDVEVASETAGDAAANTQAVASESLGATPDKHAQPAPTPAWISTGDWPEEPAIGSDGGEPTSTSRTHETAPAEPAPSWESTLDPGPSDRQGGKRPGPGDSAPQPDWESPFAGLAEEQPPESPTAEERSPLTGLPDEKPLAWDVPDRKPPPPGWSNETSPLVGLSDDTTPAADRSPLADLTEPPRDPSAITYSRDERSPLTGLTDRPEDPAPLADLDWLHHDSATSSSVHRREGPVPGVWKRSKRDPELTASSD